MGLTDFGIHLSFHTPSHGLLGATGTRRPWLWTHFKYNTSGNPQRQGNPRDHGSKATRVREGQDEGNGHENGQPGSSGHGLTTPACGQACPAARGPALLEPIGHDTAPLATQHGKGIPADHHAPGVHEMKGCEGYGPGTLSAGHLVRLFDAGVQAAPQHVRDQRGCWRRPPR